LWGESYTASAGELPAVQDRIADDLSRRLRGEPRPVSRAYTQNSRANEEYLQGLYAWNRRGREDLLQSIAHFNRAIELDPKFAAAYSGLANAYGVMGGNGLLDPKEASVNVLTAAHKALELDPNNAEAYTSIATASYRTLFDFAGAERDYRRSIELNPNYATAHQWYSQYLREMGRVDEARREIDIALKLDPLSRPINAGACFGLLLDRRYRDAAAFARNSETLGRPLPQCAARAELALQDDPLTRKTLVQARLKTLLAEPDVEFAFPVEVAECYAILGDPDQAFAWLNKAVERRATHATSFHLFPGFDPIRRDPRFAELVHRIGLPEAAYQ
jgi:tetratricopeptide (TPR) repeat protein